MSDAGHNLVLHVSYDGKCLVDSVRVGGRECVRAEGGVCSAMKLEDEWFTTRATIPRPTVNLTASTLSISGIRFGPPRFTVIENWHFTVNPARIVWQIDRTYPTAALVQDMAMPGWEFRDLSTWSGALLGHGGVAWCKLFNTNNASYGVHNGKVTLWKQGSPVCLRIDPCSPTGSQIATRFSRQTNGAFFLGYSVTDQPRATKHDLSRYQRDHQDIWVPFLVPADGAEATHLPDSISKMRGNESVELSLCALDYDRAYDRGRLEGVDGTAVRDICHTIARIGAVDELLLGSNSYYSDVAVLHEPWLAQLGLAIDDPDYFRSFSDTLDFQRQHAIGADGRVKSRWAGRSGDEMHGTYDAFGYYECQWGWLMDSQTSWVINVAEQFDFIGDRAWLERQKITCETALDYLLARDTDGDGLVKMMTSSHREGKGSDWLDVVWASYENALVNAQMYWALVCWAEAEELLGDEFRAERYSASAARLKQRFNAPTSSGGFWDQANECYAHWRDQDGSIHGTNFVVPVNFSAIGYGLCDLPERRRAILDRLEAQMSREQLFFWPVCLFPYAHEEGHSEVNWPFPNYENGDLFLAWGELGTRAYASYNPALALKYVKNVLAQYAEDGLAFQRYARKSQMGTGDDMLANNSSAIVGLYRNLYGVQPKYNRLYLEPHLTPELSGSLLNYWLRDQHYRIGLQPNDYTISVDGSSIHDTKPFGFSNDAQKLEYFYGSAARPSLTISLVDKTPLKVRIGSWNEGTPGRSWSESGGKTGVAVLHVVSHLVPQASYWLACNGKRQFSLRADAYGRVTFKFRLPGPHDQTYELAPK
jgi:hypothetical protein